MQKVECKFLLRGSQELPACEREARNPFVTGKQH
jgi:hypothetical protein